MKSPARRNRTAEVDYGGERRSNATYASVTDADARLFKRSQRTGAAHCFTGHSLIEKSSRLVVQVDLTQAAGHAERRTVIDMLHRHSPGSTRRLTLVVGRGYDSTDFGRRATPDGCHTSCCSEVPAFSYRRMHDQAPGYAKSQRRRRKIEEPFGWIKTVYVSTL